jgi:tetratricopeptide (TPR) repeat protein
LTASLFIIDTFFEDLPIFSARIHLSGYLRAMRFLLLASLPPLFPLSVLAQTKPSSSPAQFKSLSEQAAVASGENRLDEAAALYRKALLLQPRWADGWWALGTLQYDQNRYADAARAFEKLVALKPENGTAHAMLGLCQVELQHDELALKHFVAARQLGILDDLKLRHVVLYQLGSVQLRLRKFGDASVTLGQLVVDGVRTQEVTDGLGMAALLIQPMNLPEKGTPGRDVVEHAGQAQSLAAVKDYETGKQIFALVAGEYPAYPNVHYAFGRFLLNSHETDEALTEFERELQNDPDHLGALLELAGVRYRTDSADGVKYAEHAVKLNPQLPFGHYLLGLLYLDTGRAADAIPELEIARRAFANEPNIYYALGNAYARVGRKDEAFRTRAEFVRLNAAKNDNSGSSVYGEHPSGVLDQKLQDQSAQTPPKP